MAARTGHHTVTMATRDGEGIQPQERDHPRVPVLTLLHHPRCERVGERAILTELVAGKVASLSRLEPFFAQPASGDPRPLSDPYLSRTPLSIATASKAGGLEMVRGASHTAVLADGAPLTEKAVFTPQQLSQGVVLELANRVVLLLHVSEVRGRATGGGGGLIGESEAMHRLRREILQVADLDVPVLLRGETGTGKELVARAIHQASQRHRGTFLSLNMGAVPTTLAATELFGASKGAFTGADRSQPGYFLRANGGTLLLDEIGEAPPEVQVMLLRVLETGEIQRVGMQEPTQVDVRLLAATDVNLEKAIEEGRFRAPLLHRLSGYEIYLPPLRERRDDFGRLFFHFLRQELRQLGDEHRLDLATPSGRPWMSASIVARLARHSWPGNVRQLRNVARQIVIGSRGSGSVEVSPQVERLLREAMSEEGVFLSSSRSIATGETLVPLPRAGREAPPAEEPKRARRAPSPYRKPSQVGEEELLAALRDNRWEIKPTALQLGISRPSLYMLIDRAPDIRKAGDLSEEEIRSCWDQVAGDLGTLVERLEVSESGLVQRLKQLGLA